jgi:hypothetical protein
MDSRFRHRPEQGFLAVKMTVQGCRSETCRFPDPPHGRILEAVLRELLPGCIKYFLMTFVLVSGHILLSVNTVNLSSPVVNFN